MGTHPTWSEFYVDQDGWVPIDISEAWKHQEKHDYFFSARGSHRVRQRSSHAFPGASMLRKYRWEPIRPGQHRTPTSSGNPGSLPNAYPPGGGSQSRSEPEF